MKDSSKTDHELWGEDWSQQARAQKRAPAVEQMRGFFAFFENTILSDDRRYILGTDKPMLADVQSAWIFDWMLSLEGAFPEDVISQRIYPKTFAWCQRYHSAVDEATKSASKPEEIDGAEALKRLEKSSTEGNIQIDDKEPLGLKQGQDVEVTPIDTGKTGVQKGKLLGLDRDGGSGWKQDQIRVTAASPLSTMELQGRCLCCISTGRTHVREEH